MDAKYIINRWPSAKALADDLGQNSVTIRAWKRRNRIPGSFWVAVRDAAKRRGFSEISLEVVASAYDSEMGDPESYRQTPLRTAQEDDRDRKPDHPHVDTCPQPPEKATAQAAAE